jgi:hypothetical protein
MILSLLSKKEGGLRGRARGVDLIPFTVAEKARTVGLNRPGLGYLHTRRYIVVRKKDDIISSY